MSTSIGQDEPHRSPKKAYFSCAIGVHFMSFFYEHPVFKIMSSCIVCWEGFLKDGFMKLLPIWHIFMNKKCLKKQQVLQFHILLSSTGISLEQELLL